MASVKHKINGLSHHGEVDMHIRGTSGVMGTGTSEDFGGTKHNSFKDSWLGGHIEPRTLKLLLGTIGLFLIFYLFWFYSGSS